MANDYFEDITPEETPVGKPLQKTQPAPEPEVSEDDPVEVPIKIGEAPPRPQAEARGIRTIAPSAQRMRMTDMREVPAPPAPPRERRRAPGRWWMWGIALVLILALAGLMLLAFRKTTVTVVPKSHQIVFDSASQVTAYPAATAATGTLTYVSQISDLEDSEVVPTSGTTHQESKASGSIVVYNEYSADPVKLIKNTRFEAPGGLVFRVPADVVVPGKKGSTPGQVSVTVIADQAGTKYNVGPVARFTLPGLKSNADMYANVYAKSTEAMKGGFSGDAPAAAPGAIETAISTIRGRLAEKAGKLVGTDTADTIVIPAASITYEDMPNTTEASGGVRVHQKAHVVALTLQNAALASAVAQSVAADAEQASISFMPGSDFAIKYQASTSTSVGADPIALSFSGKGLLVWKVDTAALSTALAARDQGAFQTIVNGFPAIEEAHARIEPFWKSSFPANAADIRVVVDEPKI